MVKVSQFISKMGWKITSEIIEKTKKLRPFTPKNYSAFDQEKFKTAQRLAYQCALEIGKKLKAGCTEKYAADLMDAYLMDSGVKTFFHRSFAWFGDRTRFQNFKNYFHFLPSDRKLKSSDVVILDTAPIVEGYTADIGYTFSLETHPELLKAQKKLLQLREKIPKLFESGLKTKDIWREVDQDLQADGYHNIHSLYPFAVLGHRVHRVSGSQLPGVIRPFTWQSYWALLSRGLYPDLLGPDHEGSSDGLWAIEPHLGGEGFGAKFEEILVVQDGKAKWLDDQVPHLARIKE